MKLPNRTLLTVNSTTEPKGWLLLKLNSCFQQKGELVATYRNCTHESRSARSAVAVLVHPYTCSLSGLLWFACVCRWCAETARSSSSPSSHVSWWVWRLGASSPAEHGAGFFSRAKLFTRWNRSKASSRFWRDVTRRCGGSSPETRSEGRHFCGSQSWQAFSSKLKQVRTTTDERWTRR